MRMRGTPQQGKAVVPPAGQVQQGGREGLYRRALRVLTAPARFVRRVRALLDRLEHIAERVERWLPEDDPRYPEKPRWRV